MAIGTLHQALCARYKWLAAYNSDAVLLRNLSNSVSKLWAVIRLQDMRRTHECHPRCKVGRNLGASALTDRK